MIDFDNVTIKPDRFGMAAISTIFKAFGDNIRSKEYWPWSERMGNDWAWESSKGYENDLNYAIDLIKYALNRINSEDDENMDNTINSSAQNIKDLKKRINKLIDGVNESNNITDAINTTSAETSDELNNYEIENITSHE